MSFHEFGHFIAARMCGVRVLRFAVGFGKPLYTFHAKNKTEWVLAAIPLGGYVKMYGDKNGASTPDYENIANFSEAEKKQSFIFKSTSKINSLVYDVKCYFHN